MECYDYYRVSGVLHEANERTTHPDHGQLAGAHHPEQISGDRESQECLQTGNNGMAHWRCQVRVKWRMDGVCAHAFRSQITGLLAGAVQYPLNFRADGYAPSYNLTTWRLAINVIRWSNPNL